MHAVAAGGFRVAGQPDGVQRLPRQQGGLHNVVVAALVRIQVDQNEVRIVQRARAAHPGIVVDAPQVRQVKERRLTVAKHVFDHVPLAVGLDIHGFDPLGKLLARHVLLEEELAVDAVGVAFQRQGAVLEMGQDPMRDIAVILNNVALGDAVFGEKDLLQVAEFLLLGRSFFGHFADAVLRRLIVPQTQEDGRAQQAFGGELQVFHFANQFRLYPGNGPQGALEFLGERAFRDNARFQLGEDFGQAALVEAGSHLPRVHQLAVVVQPQHQGAEVRPFAMGEAADHEFLLIRHLDLQPVAAAPAFVRTIGAFRQNAFQAALPGRLQHLRTHAGEVVGEADMVGGLYDFVQQALPLDQRDGAQVMPVQVEQVEQKQRDRGLAGQVRDGVGVGDRDARLD